MKMETRFRKAMAIEDEGKRLAALESIAMSICWHGGTWQEIMDEIRRMKSMGVKTPLQKKIDENGGKYPFKK